MRTTAIPLLFVAMTTSGLAGAVTSPTTAPVAGRQGSPEGIAVIRWSLTNEQNIAQFRVFRGESREGPWTLIATVEGQGAGAHGPQVYIQRDRGLEVGSRVLYMIEHEDTSGRAVRAGPVSYVVEAPASVEKIAGTPEE